MNIVWFKRDLRVEDHAALSQAALCTSPVLPVYILEPKLWQQPDMSRRHYQFLVTSLQELDISLREMGQGLVIKVGEAINVLQQLHNKHGIQALWSHQETWNSWTYQRDEHIRSWLKQHDIAWHEPRQNGVVRCLKNRDGWANQWYQHMKKPLISPPESLSHVNEVSDKLPSAEYLGLAPDGCAMPPKGGRSEALRLLHSFLKERGEHYSQAMSSPVTAFDSCSRLSPHLAFGTVSLREVFQTKQHYSQLTNNQPKGSRGQWPKALRSFASRLRWHCHFIQKLEDEPRIESENMHPAYDRVRTAFNENYFEAWRQGCTGLPMIDACMRALTTTGWLNFRMRAMLMSFASYHLWLPWREPALHLARLFVDYEPGIHYSQVQMQSGTTGINSLRIYNPIKQGVDQDPEGCFIRQWIPELAYMQQAFIHMPWQSPNEMNGYPWPIVDEKAARQAAADAIYQIRQNAKHKQKAQQIVAKHGSRQSRSSRTKKSKSQKKQSSNPKQGELPF